MSEVLLEKELLKLPFHIPLPVDGSDSEPVSMFCEGRVKACIDFFQSQADLLMTVVVKKLQGDRVGVEVMYREVAAPRRSPRDGHGAPGVPVVEGVNIFMPADPLSTNIYIVVDAIKTRKLQVWRLICCGTTDAERRDSKVSSLQFAFESGCPEHGPRLRLSPTSHFGMVWNIGGLWQCHWEGFMWTATTSKQFWKTLLEAMVCVVRWAMSPTYCRRK